MQFFQENGLSCPFCDSNIQDFRKHISDQNGNSERNTLSNCNSCDLVIQNENCMKKHEEKVHGGLYSGIICEECNIDFFGPENLKYHQELSHNEDVLTKIHAFEANANNIAVEESESEAEKHDCSFCVECFDDEKMFFSSKLRSLSPSIHKESLMTVLAYLDPTFRILLFSAMTCEKKRNN